MRAFSQNWIMDMKDFLTRFLLTLVCLVGLAFSLVSIVWCLFSSSESNWRQLVALDQLVNASMGPFLNTLFGVKEGDPSFGNEDETISSVLGKLYDRGSGNHLVDILNKVLNVIDRNHCKKSIETDEVLVED